MECDVSAENLERLRRLLVEGFGRGDLSVIDELVAEDLVEHQADVPHQGRDGLKNMVRSLRQAFPDLGYTVVQTVSDGDKAWGHFRSAGTHKGPFMGHLPTEKRIEIGVIDIARFEKHWGVPDRLKLLSQLGIFPKKAS